MNQFSVNWEWAIASEVLGARNLSMGLVGVQSRAERWDDKIADDSFAIKRDI